MTATLVDETILNTHFSINKDSILNVITPDTAGDIGDRMIFLPQVINPTISDCFMKTYLKYLSTIYNVVVIVPSDNRANFWKDIANQVLNKTNFSMGIKKLHSIKNGLTILINRYDGVDLPYEACRVLVIDGLPDVRSLKDKKIESILTGSGKMKTKLIQKIEQGIGRGIRANDDYCLVFLMGLNLVRQLGPNDAFKYFSPSFQVQFNLSKQVSEQISTVEPQKTVDDINDVAKYCLEQQTQWLQASKGVLTELTYDTEIKMDSSSVLLREAYDLSQSSQVDAAISRINDAVNIETNNKVKGYYKQILAEYTNLVNPVGAQEILQSAQLLNQNILKPIHGIRYQKLQTTNFNQAQLCSSYLARMFNNTNAIIIELNGIIDSLKFETITANTFEENFKCVANFIGIVGQRPENEFGKGPDVLWETGELIYFVVECKNEATASIINKSYCNQLNGSIEWFEGKYDHTCSCTPIMIHPSANFEYASSPNVNTRIIDKEKLELLCSNLKGFIIAITSNNSLNDISEINKNIMHFKLRNNEFITKYTKCFSVQQR